MRASWASNVKSRRSVLIQRLVSDRWPLQYSLPCFPKALSLIVGNDSWASLVEVGLLAVFGASYQLSWAKDASVLSYLSSWHFIRMLFRVELLQLGNYTSSQLHRIRLQTYIYIYIHTLVVFMYIYVWTVHNMIPFFPARLYNTCPMISHVTNWLIINLYV